MTMEMFKDICRMSQKGLKKHVAKQLREKYTTVISDDGFVYAKGDFPVLLVAHLDTVHKKLPGKIKYNKGKLSSPNGIGGDDRCGVYMIFDIIKEYNCSVLFCEDEEIGGVGSDKFIKTKLAGELVGTFNYLIEFDRKGSNDAVFYDCANTEFEDFITKEFYKTQYGSFSDISTLAPFLKAAAVNLSCGYYNAHTKTEYLVWKEMLNSISEAKKILARTTENDKFEYIESPYSNALLFGGYYDDFYSYGSYGSYYGESVYYVEYRDVITRETKIFDTYAFSEEEALGLFCIKNPDSCYNDVIDIYAEDMVFLNTKKEKYYK